MTKIRKISSIEHGLNEVVKYLEEDDIKAAIGKGASYIRKCSDPEADDEKIKRNIHHCDSVALDIACLKKGKSAPLLQAHKYMIEKELQSYEPQQVNIDEMLVKLNILEGDLSKVIKESQDPKSHKGEEISEIEKKKIFDSIKLLENKIHKIKVIIEKL